MSRVYRFFTKITTLDRLQQGQNLLFGKELEPDIFFQLTKVLRVKTASEIVLTPTDQKPTFFDYHFTIQEIDNKNITLSFKQKFENKNELDFELCLLLCLPNKPEKLEFIAQKAVELGVNKITLVQGDFSQMKHQLRPERLQKIIKEAAEQSERGLIPELISKGILRDCLQKEQSPNLLVALERLENSPQSSLPDLLKEALKQKPSVAILIGPEGGFSDQEKQMIKEIGAQCFSLGKRILRMETAALVSFGIASMMKIN
jgi:16S rRNA (uracil1498-N3)-methyltransferase